MDNSIKEKEITALLTIAEFIKLTGKEVENVKIACRELAYAIAKMNEGLLELTDGLIEIKDKINKMDKH